jgi:hypothetical protein
MRKQAFLVIPFTIVTTSLLAQDPFSKEIIRDFRAANNDSLFVIQHSDLPYSEILVDFSWYADSSVKQLRQDLLKAETGSVLGPYYSDTTVVYVKITGSDSAFMARVGNIWIDINRGRETALQIANKVLSEIKNGKSFDLYCHLYSDDKNKAKDCDLGWIYHTQMIEAFAEEITRHKKDDVYLVETTYGFHIVKSLADPYRQKKTIRYVTLARKRK